MSHDASRERLSVCHALSRDEQAFLAEQLHKHNAEATGGRHGFPGEDESGLAFEMAVKDAHGRTVGGVSVSSVLGVMWLEVLWVADEFRRRGLASWLVLEAERIACEKGCVGAGTWTFNWQGPDFYPTIGYDLRGVYDGYPFGVTEHVLTKRLPDDASLSGAADRIARLRREGFALVPSPAGDEMRIVERGFHEFCARNAGEEMHYPEGGVQLALRDGGGRVVGGLDAFMTLRVMVLETLWIESRYRGQGYGRTLLMEAERAAREAGCVAVSSHCLSFQSPGFFHRVGYSSFGTVDVYVDGHTEDLLIKRL